MSPIDVIFSDQTHPACDQTHPVCPFSKISTLMLNISGTIRQENIKFWEIKIQTIDSLPEKIRNFFMKIERVIVQKPPKLIKLTPFDGIFII